MARASDAAKYLIALDNSEAGDLMSNLKLQKLLYYAQGVHLAFYGKPLFLDKIEAWDHGPVCPSVYHEYKGHGSGPLPASKDFDGSVLSKKERDVLDQVHTVFGQFSAWRLREMTHAEPALEDGIPAGQGAYHNRPRLDAQLLPDDSQVVSREKHLLPVRALGSDKLQPPSTASAGSTNLEHPVFCLRYLKNVDGGPNEHLAALVCRLKALCQLTWQQIMSSPRHAMGTEKIPVKSLRVRLDPIAAEQPYVIAFRFSGQRPMLGLREGPVFRILHLDYDFTAYDHGS